MEGKAAMRDRDHRHFRQGEIVTGSFYQASALDHARRGHVV
jgi:hypothetical protein